MSAPVGKDVSITMSDEIFEEIEDEVSDVLGGGAYMLVGMVTTNFLGFLIHVKLATALKPTGYGLLVLGLMIISTGSRFLQFGLGEGLTRYITRFDSLSEQADVIKSGILPPILAALFVAVLLFVFAQDFAVYAFDDPGLTPVLKVVSIAVPIGVVLKLLISIVRGYEMARGRTISMIVEKGLLTVAIYALGTFLSPVTAVAVWTASFVAGIIAAGILLYSKVSGVFSAFLKSSTTHKRELMTFSAPLIISGTFTLLMNNVDTFLIGYFLESSMVGQYNVAYKLSNFVLLPLGFVGFIFFPVSSKLYKNNKVVKLRDLLNLMNKWGTMSVFPVLFVFLAYPTLAVTFVFGDQYTVSGQILRILSFGYIVHLISGKTGETLKTGGYTAAVMYTSVAGVIANVGLNILLIPWIGIRGAAIATGVSFIIGGMVGILFLKKRMGFWPVSKSYLMQCIRGIVAGVLTVLILSIVPNSVRSSTLFFLIVATMTFVAIYISVNQIGAGFSEERILVDIASNVTGLDLRWVKRYLM